MNDWWIITLLKWPGMDPVGVLRALGYAPDDIEDHLTYDDIGQLEQPGPAIAACDGWFMLGHPAVQLMSNRADDDVLPEQWSAGLASMPKGSCAWLIECAGHSWSVAFTLLEDGVVRRRYMIVDGAINTDLGKPLPEEKELAKTISDEGDRLFALLKRRGVALAKFANQQFALYSPE